MLHMHTTRLTPHRLAVLVLLAALIALLLLLPYTALTTGVAAH